MTLIIDTKLEAWKRRKTCKHYNPHSGSCKIRKSVNCGPCTGYDNMFEKETNDKFKKERIL